MTLRVGQVCQVHILDDVYRAELPVPELVLAARDSQDEPDEGIDAGGIDRRHFRHYIAQADTAFSILYRCVIAVARLE